MHLQPVLRGVGHVVLGHLRQFEQVAHRFTSHGDRTEGRLECVGRSRDQAGDRHVMGRPNEATTRWMVVCSGATAA